MKHIESTHTVEFTTDAGLKIKVTSLREGIFRIRATSTDQFPESALERYAVINEPAPSESPIIEREGSTTRIESGGASLEVNSDDGRCVLSARGRVLLREIAAPACRPSLGFQAKYELLPGTRLYGLGDVSRDRIERRGQIAHLWVKNVDCYVPMPVLLSSTGWGIILCTTFRHYFDLGSSKPNELVFGGRRGTLDYFLISGDSLADLLDRATTITGRPALLPLWAYGFTFVCNQQADAREMLDDCLNLRRESIPCDLVGLEPGWMERYYDYTTEKKWHPERFYIPYWSSSGPHTFLSAAARLGFKMSLWLCCDYDLSHEEERQVRDREGVVEAGGSTPTADAPIVVHPDDFEKDQHIGHEPVLMDGLTKPAEAWFEHLKQFVDQGVSAFKLDGARQVNEHPDRRWGNGMDDEEMHNLYPLLLNKQMSTGFRQHTGRRPMIYSSGGYLGIQQFTATWAGDTGGGPKPLVSILNHGLSGHSNASCDMDVFTPEGIHFGFLLPWSQLCSWAYWRHPWFLGDTLEPIFKEYARLRYRLLPYIYTMAHRAATSGMPIARAMPLVFPDDERSDKLIHQYMFGDAFLTGAFIDSIHLPAGTWIDYWNGTVHEGPVDMPVEYPQGKGGPLFVRAGAIVPNWPPMLYVGQKPVAAMGLEVFALAEGSATLYEDDGTSYEYLNGEAAITHFGLTVNRESIELSVGRREGSYPDMPEQRSYTCRIVCPRSPRDVRVDALPVANPRIEGNEVTVEVAEGSTVSLSF